MAAILTGAIWSEAPVTDYPEPWRLTSSRLQKAKPPHRRYKTIDCKTLYDYCKARWDEERQTLGDFGRVLTRESPRWRELRDGYYRTHCPPPPPTSASSAECTTSIADESPSASIDELTPSKSPPSSNTGESSPWPPSSSLASAEPGELTSENLPIDEPRKNSATSQTPSEPPADAPLEWSTTQIREDNSCLMPPTDDSIEPETFLKRILADALWAYENAMHVKAGRVKIRDNPRTAAAWLQINSALSDPRQFLTAVITRCETALSDHDKRLAKIKADETAALERIEAKREEKRKARVNANGAIHELFDRLRSRVGDGQTTVLAGAEGAGSQS